MISINREETDFAPSGNQLRARLAARLVGWILAPGAIAAVALWLFYTSVVCWGGRPLVIELYLCKYSGLLPIFSFVFLFAGTAWLWFAMTRDGVNVRLPAMAKIDGMDSRGDPGTLSRSIQFALEMWCWAFATLIAASIFYYWEYSFPFGILTIAACFRLLWVLGRVSVYLRKRADERV